MTKPKKQLFTVTARVTLEGAFMEIEATSEGAAMAAAEANPDFDITSAELVDWKINRAKLVY